MVGLPPCRIWVVNYVTKLGEYCPAVKEVCVPLWEGHGRWNLEALDLEKSSTNARKDVIDGINSSRSRRGQITKCVRALR